MKVGIVPTVRAPGKNANKQTKKNTFNKQKDPRRPVQHGLLFLFLYCLFRSIFFFGEAAPRATNVKSILLELKVDSVILNVSMTCKILFYLMDYSNPLKSYFLQSSCFHITCFKIATTKRFEHFSQATTVAFNKCKTNYWVLCGR